MVMIMVMMMMMMMVMVMAMVMVKVVTTTIGLLIANSATLGMMTLMTMMMVAVAVAMVDRDQPDPVTRCRTCLLQAPPSCWANLSCEPFVLFNAFLKGCTTSFRPPECVSRNWRTARASPIDRSRCLVLL